MENENDPGKQHWQFKQLVPVVDSATGKVLGKARPSKIIGAHTNSNWYAYINFKGKDIACSCDTSKQDLKIVVYEDEEIWVK